MSVASMPTVRRLAEARAPWCVTLYADADAWLHGSHATGAARGQIRDAVHVLTEAGAPAEVAEAVRSRLTQSAAPSADRAPADHRIRSVGVFATPDQSELHALTTTPAAWVGVDDRFLIAPLLEGVLSSLPPVFVLAASENRVRLVAATDHPARVVDVPGLPRDLRSELRLDLTGDRDTLAHLRTSEDPKERLSEYAHAIHRSVEPVRRAARALLLVAAAEPLSGILQATAPDPRLVLGALPGNHDDDTPDALADVADPRVQEQRLHARTLQVARLSTASPELVLNDLDAIEDAARAGAIDTLFIDTDWRARAPGEGSPASREHDRGDALVRHALASDSTVVPVPADGMEYPGPAAALLRYAPAGSPPR